MGCPKDNPQCYFDEKPQRKVCVGDFWISETEITVEQWKRFLKISGYKPDQKHLWGCEFTGKPTFKQGKDHPVVCVNWYDAKALASWLKKQHNLPFALPTEKEWEYVCKKGGASGPDPNRMNYWSGFGGRSGKDRYRFTSPVKTFEPNALGVYDVLGNVWEWTEDWYSVPGIPSPKEKKVIKGGGWETQDKNVRCSVRRGIDPKRRYDTIGIRLIIRKNELSVY